MDTTDIGATIVDDLLQHHGVLGMHWGRRGASSSGSTAKSSGGTVRGQPHTRIIAKKKDSNIFTEAGRRNIRSRQLSKAINHPSMYHMSRIHNRSVAGINKDLAKLHSTQKPLKKTHNLGFTSHPANKKYNADVAAIIQKHYQKSLNDIYAKDYTNHTFKIVHQKSKWTEPGLVYKRRNTFKVAVMPKKITHDGLSSNSGEWDMSSYPTIEIELVHDPKTGLVTGIDLTNSDFDPENFDPSAYELPNNSMKQDGVSATPESFKIMLVKDSSGNVRDLNVTDGSVADDGDTFRAMITRNTSGKVESISVIDNDVDDVDGPDTICINVLRDNLNNIIGFEIIDDDDRDDVMSQGEKFVDAFLAHNGIFGSIGKCRDDSEFINSFLEHHGVLGMKWGHRSSALNHPDISHIPMKTRKEAHKDAKEFTRAKLFYGEGAGVRRRLIKAKVETKMKQDKFYTKAFNHFVKQTDLATRAAEARVTRKRKDTGKFVKRTVKRASRIVAPFVDAELTTRLGG